tara:strand:+ start:35 stop:757 length:723 start_codon:yes stop_codon:yes gene_type:complete
MNVEQSLGSQTARSGFRAEAIFRSDVRIKQALATYFNKPIRQIIKAPNGRKYDNIIIFQDGTRTNIQNKKFQSLGGRGDSFDRRHIQKTFDTTLIRKYLTVLTLIRKHKRKTLMTNEQKKDFIILCNKHLDDIKQYIQKTLLGIPGSQNDYWCFMKTDKDFSFMDIYIINSKTFYTFIESTLNIDIKLKTNGTCLHLSPNIVLQRKGGGKTDHAPNHIQAKLKITQNILDICDKILLICD